MQVAERYFDALSHSGLLSGTPMSSRDKTRFAFFLISMILLSGALYAQHGHRPHEPKRMERKQVEMLEQQWQQAMLSDDVSAMDKLLSDDYLGVTAGGDLVTKSQQLDRMRKRQVTVTKLDTTEVKFKLIGQIAIVTSLTQIEGVADGRDIKGGFRTTRVYQRLPAGVWKLTSFESTRVAPGSRTTQSASAVTGQN
jgi:ketosteroid isomerase-like protein